MTQKYYIILNFLHLYENQQIFIWSHIITIVIQLSLVYLIVRSSF